MEIKYDSGDLLSKLHRLEKTSAKAPLASVSKSIIQLYRKVYCAFLKPKYLKDYVIILDSDLFDDTYYLANQPDVESVGMDPLIHYLNCGAYEGRNPNPLFDSTYYLNKYPDIKAVNTNPLLHYILHGESEGREPFAGIHQTEVYAQYCLSSGDYKNGFLYFCLKTQKYSEILKEISSNDLGAQEKSSLLLDVSEQHSISISRHKIYTFGGKRAGNMSRKDISKVSIIILNLNGDSLLDLLLSSLIEVNSAPLKEVIIVDHNSTDRSLDIISRYDGKLPIEVIKANQNHSFSYSNNRAAEMAGGDVIIFLNNDILFEQDCVADLVAYLKDDNVGIVGLKLYENSINKGYKFVESADDFHHIGVRFKADHGALFYRPYNAKPGVSDALVKDFPTAFPAVTGAFMAVRRDEFLSVGGFSEGFNYGYEDVDLCLKYQFCLAKQVICANDIYAIHADGQTRKVASSDTKLLRRQTNDALLRKRFGYRLRQSLRDNRLEDDGSWGLGPLHIAFAVTEAYAGAKAGDYFTAAELGQCLHRKFGCQVSYLPLGQWYQLPGVDVVIAMRDEFEPGEIEVQEPHLIKIAWLRNWFERWADFDQLSEFDVLACSSSSAADYIQASLSLPTQILRIATNPRRFTPGTGLEAPTVDYVFTGSFWGVKRDISDCLFPDKLTQYAGAVYGHGWQSEPVFSGIYKGFLKYEDLPAVYRSSKVVIDDANHATKDFGSVNSRVFDAIAAGSLPITNGELGAHETFGSLLPTYSSRETLESQLHRYLTDTALLDKTVSALRQEVLTHHTYDVRADELKQMLLEYTTQSIRFSIKIPVPDREQLKEWGDYHFAKSLRKEIRKQGHRVRIDIIPDWYCAAGVEDDVVIVLRGLTAYTPHPDKINILWNISHPEHISDAEYETYDHVFVASTDYAKRLSERLTVSVSPLIQCTDPDIFYPPDKAERLTLPPVLFVGNSRKVLRQSVKYAIAADLDISVYGTRWDPLIPGRYIKGQHIPNQELHKYYASANIVLNDHWDTMAGFGFLSNRLFDVAAAGGFVLSDAAKGIEQVFSDLIPTYKDADDFNQKIRFFLANPDIRAKKSTALHQLVVSEHTFAKRSDTLLAVVAKLVSAKKALPEDAPLKATGGGFLSTSLRR
ncbi:MAG: glycosyltransferase [Cyanobacteria bacterium J06635_15]